MENELIDSIIEQNPERVLAWFIRALQENEKMTLFEFQEALDSFCNNAGLELLTADEILNHYINEK